MKLALTAIAVTFGLMSAAAYADPPPAPPPPKAKSVCLNAGDIDHYSYPDDKTILIHMKGGKVRIWRSDLPRACPGLKFEQGIALEIRGGTICSNMQVVYVLRRWTPCFLGPFTPVTPPPKEGPGVPPPPKP
jgi:hypothetical protein